MTDLVRINSGLSSSATPLTAAPFTLDAGTLPIVPSTEVRPTFHVLYKRLHFSKNKTQYVCVYTHIYVIIYNYMYMYIIYVNMYVYIYIYGE